MIKVTLGEKPKEEKETKFPLLATLYKGGGLFIALSKKRFFCIDKGDSGWSVGELDEKEYFAWGENGFVEITGQITLQNI